MKEFFQFLKNPEQQPPLRFVQMAPEIWNALGKIERTLWLKEGVPNPETIQEHTLATIEIANVISGLSEAEHQELRDMLEIHGWPKVKTGDEINLDMSARQKAMIDITSYLGNAGEEILALWMRFETSEDKIASLAREIDKYQLIDKAHFYEKKYRINLFDKIYDQNIGKISHPPLLRDLTHLKALRDKFKTRS